MLGKFTLKATWMRQVLKKKIVLVPVCVLETKEVNSFVFKPCGQILNQHLKKRKYVWSLRQALLFMNLNFTQVIIGLDIKLVVDGTSSKHSHKLEFSVILNVCRKLFCSLSNFRISFIQRQTNNVAYFLARATLSYASH